LEAGGRDLRVARLLANSANGFRPYVLMSDALLNRASLRAPLREVAILAIATHLHADYEWEEHVSMSRAAGVTDEQREAIRNGELDADCFSEEEREAMRLALIVLEGGLTLEDWSQASERWGQDAALDLVFTVGWWGGFMHLVIAALADHGLR
jgi:alkylhydroperoxidase family enzyme